MPSVDYTASLVVSLEQMGVAARRRALPLPRYPIADEMDYAGRIIGMVRRWVGAYGELALAMPRLLVSFAAGFRHDAGEPEFARRLLEEARARARTAVSAAEVAELAELAGNRTSIATRRDIARQLRAGLGVEIDIDETAAREMLRAFSIENAQRIGSIPARLHEDIASLTMRAITKRMTPETFAAELLKIADVTEGKAMQLARDQLGSLWGQLSEIRQRELGLSHYIWRTMRDNRVRKTHRAREGVRFAWRDAPPGGHPGVDIGCRCGAQPDLTPIIAAIAARKIHARPVGRRIR